MITHALRTPIGKFAGALSELSAADLGVHAVRAVLERSAVDPASVGELVFADVDQASLFATAAATRGHRRPACRHRVPVAAQCPVVVAQIAVLHKRCKAGFVHPSHPIVVLRWHATEVS